MLKKAIEKAIIKMALTIFADKQEKPTMWGLITG